MAISDRRALNQTLGDAVCKLLPADANFLLLYQHDFGALQVISSNLLTGEAVKLLRDLADQLEATPPDDPEVHNVE